MVTRNRILVIVLCLPLLLVAAGCGSNQERAASYVARGNRYMQSGDAMRAILEYKNALQLNPRSSAALLAMGKAYVAEKQYLEAYRSLNAALELSPKLDPARLEIAKILSGGQPKLALEQISKLRKPESFEPQVSIVKASALIALKNYKQAADVLQKTRGADTSAEAQKLLAICLEQTGDYKAMLEAADKSASLAPKSSFPYLFKAKFDADHGDKAGAVKELDQMVKADPKDSARLMRAKAFEELRMLPEAREAYEKLPNSVEMQKQRAGFYLRQGEKDKVQEILESILAKDPTDVQTTLALVEILQSKGDSSGSLKRIDEALGHDIKSDLKDRLLLTKASIIADKGDRDKAAAICLDVLRENQGDYNAHLLLGRLLLNEGKYEEAQIHLQQAATGMPKNVDACILLAHSQLLNKNEAMAANTLLGGVKQNPKNDRLRMEYFRFLLSKKNLADAVALMNKGLEIEPANPVFLEARGSLLASQTQYSKAEADFGQMIKLAPDSSAGYIEMGRLMLTQSKPDKAIGWLKQALSAKKGWEMAIPILAAACDKAGQDKSCMDLIVSETAKRPTASGFLQIGRVYAMHKDLADAQKAFSKASQLAPDSILPLKAMAVVLTMQGKIDSAIAQEEKMYRIDPSESNALNLAMLYEQRGRTADASHLLDALLHKSGNSPAVMNDLAYFYAQYSADPKVLKKAAKLATEALAGQPQNAVFLDTAAWVAYRQGDLGAAWSRIRSALLLKPDDGSMNLHAAQIAQKQGNLQEAKTYLKKALKESLDSISRKTALDLEKQLKG